MKLSGKINRFLRAEGHHLSAILQTGKEGVTQNVIEEIGKALNELELIKIKIGKGPTPRKEAAEKIRQETGAHIIQIVGRIILLFRQAKKGSIYKLPE